MATTFQPDIPADSAQWPAANPLAVSLPQEAASPVGGALTGDAVIPDGLRYVARQPIMNGRGNVHGYELLFRAGPTAAFSGDGNAATRTMLDNAVVFGLDKLSAGMLSFINCTEEALLNKLVMVLPPERTVLELLETLEPTEALLAACTELKAHGFRLALDDFEWKPKWKRFVDIADYVKVDISKTTPAQRQEVLDQVRQSKAAPTVLMVAERVETPADLAMVRREGFTLFQGYYFCRPVLMRNRAIPANHLVHLELLRALVEIPLDTQHVSALVKRDASLTYRLLRVVNSPLYALRKEIRSIHGALVMIGDEMFRRVLTLAITAELRGNQPTELLRMAFLRGRFCELAAPLLRQDSTEQYLLGILSMLPAMLHISMEQIAEQMPLRAAMKAALLGGKNTEHALLEWLICYELGHWESCDRVAQLASLSPDALLDVYGTSVLWAETNLSLAGFQNA